MLTKKSTQSTRKAVTGTWRTTLDHRPSLSMGPSPILSDQLLLRKPWNPRKEGGSYSGGSKSSMLTCTRHSLGLFIQLTIRTAGSPPFSHSVHQGVDYQHVPTPDGFPPLPTFLSCVQSDVRPGATDSHNSLCGGTSLSWLSWFIFSIYQAPNTRWASQNPLKYIVIKILQLQTNNNS